MSSNWAEATKNIYCAKSKGAIDKSVIRWRKKFRWGCKNLDEWACSDRPESVNFEAVLVVDEANPTSRTWRVSGKLGISQFILVHYLHGLIKSIWNRQNVPHVTKILQNFCSIKLFNFFITTSTQFFFNISFLTRKKKNLIFAWLVGWLVGLMEKQSSWVM